MSNNDAFRNDDRGIWSDDTTALQHDESVTTDHGDQAAFGHGDQATSAHGDHTNFTAGEASGSREQPADIPPRALPRPSGPSWGTVALGLICLVVAGGAFWVEWASLDLDWTRSGPLTLVGLGIILVLVGLAALLRRSDDDEDLDSGG
ncbi:hypothetical protein FNH13_03510 [Ornithinimicrobium ciconiae]|uniref:Uncharacterized protein n=1 Tax=Ornithinimicrobium ciconiae TaxID=2594265 RepID=A0A516G7M4_9MICO|nr:hypothetical protein [Ornithinimicrobium ciconiae]QDO87518.1 hypothetical protein FNH13_03510 [Ornithinimicrobium ciconiae]